MVNQSVPWIDISGIMKRDCRVAINAVDDLDRMINGSSFCISGSPSQITHLP